MSNIFVDIECYKKVAKLKYMLMRSISSKVIYDEPVILLYMLFFVGNLLKYNFKSPHGIDGGCPIFIAVNGGGGPVFYMTALRRGARRGDGGVFAAWLWPKRVTGSMLNCQPAWASVSRN